MVQSWILHIPILGEVINPFSEVFIYSALYVCIHMTWDGCPLTMTHATPTLGLLRGHHFVVPYNLHIPSGLGIENHSFENLPS